MDLDEMRARLVRCAARLLDASYRDDVPRDVANMWRDAAADAAAAEKALIARLRAAEARTAWQTMGTAPEGVWVLVWGVRHGNEPTTSIVARCDAWGWGERDGGAVCPTHWMPLPEPPR